jgi:hypothetical protein
MHTDDTEIVAPAFVQRYSRACHSLLLACYCCEEDDFFINFLVSCLLFILFIYCYYYYDTFLYLRCCL